VGWPLDTATDDDEEEEDIYLTQINNNHGNSTQ